MRAENEVAAIVERGGLGSLAEALAKAQSKFTAVAKTKTAKVPMKSGGTYSYNYADLADIWDMIRGPLGETGIAVLQPVETTDNGVVVTTMLIHAGSGQSLSCRVAMPTFQAGAQGLGSAITYARRYGLGSMLGIVTDEDDDGALATHGGPAPARAQQHKQPAATDRTSRAAQVAAAIRPPAVIDVKAGETEEQATLRLGSARPHVGMADGALSSAIDDARSRLESMAAGTKTHDAMKSRLQGLEAELSARMGKAVPQ